MRTGLIRMTIQAYGRTHLFHSQERSQPTNTSWFQTMWSVAGTTIDLPIFIKGQTFNIDVFYIHIHLVIAGCESLTRIFDRSIMAGITHGRCWNTGWHPLNLYGSFNIGEQGFLWIDVIVPADMAGDTIQTHFSTIRVVLSENKGAAQTQDGETDD